MSTREYLLTAIASGVGSMAGLFWALAGWPWVAGGCMVIALWGAWRVFRCDVRAE